MRRLSATVLAALVAATAASAQPLPSIGPDLAITGLTASATRVGIGETFTYTATARNNGNVPCNWVNLTLQVPGEVDFVSASSAAPLRCQPDLPIHIIGLPFDVGCRGGPGFFLFPGNTLTATFVVRARRPGNYVNATATADPGMVCFESNEANNKATSAPTAIIQRPILKMTLNKPFPPTPPIGRSPGTQIFPVTIANVGTGPAFNVALAISERFVAPNVASRAPVIDIAYKGQPAAAGQVPPGLVPPDCATVTNNNARVRTSTCILSLVLQPGERLQVHYRVVPFCGSIVPIQQPDIHVGTADDITQADHVVNIADACRL
jgi:uncharacterized repeat protein (TIGR01451 family)